MVTLSIIAVIVLSLVIAAALIVVGGGLGFLVAFGDLIVAGFIIWWIVRLFRRRR